MITVMDNRYGYPVVISKMPAIQDGFMMWNGELREVNEIHCTMKGTQIELFD